MRVDLPPIVIKFEYDAALYRQLGELVKPKESKQEAARRLALQEHAFRLMRRARRVGVQNPG